MDRRQLADDVKARVSVVEVVGRYVQLSKKGNNHTGLCPFHNENTPSFIVSEDKKIYKCFGCGEGGDAIAFVSKMESISYGDALVRLAEHANFDSNILGQIRRNNASTDFSAEIKLLQFVQGFYQYYLLNTDEGKVAIDYLARRGINKTIIEQFGIGLAPKDRRLLIKALESNSYSFEVAKSAGIIGQSDDGSYYSQFNNRIMFQVTNEQGQVIGFSGRTYLPTDDKQAKYVNSPESKIFKKSQVVYNLHEARKTARTSNRILLFEGFMDVIAAHGAGISESVATMGTALTQEHAKILACHAKEVILVFDGDKAGLAATSKAIPILFGTGLQVKVAMMPEGLDPDDVVKKYGVTKFSDAVKTAIGALDFQYEYLKQGIMIETSDGQIEFERRLTSFAAILPNSQYGQVLQRKWKNELFEARKSKNNYQQRPPQSGFYRKVENQSQAIATNKLRIESGEIKAEKELIYYMLSNKAVFEVVAGEIGTAFNIDQHRKIVQAIEAIYAKNETMDMDLLISHFDDNLKKVVQELLRELKTRPLKWSPEMIVELTQKVKLGAKKLARAGMKEMFYHASYEQQLAMMRELTTNH